MTSLDVNYSILNLLKFLQRCVIFPPYEGFIPLSFYFFWPPHAPHGISVPGPGIKPEPPASGALSLNHWTTREVPTEASVILMALKMKTDNSEELVLI